MINVSRAQISNKDVSGRFLYDFFDLRELVLFWTPYIEMREMGVDGVDGSCVSRFPFTPWDTVLLSQMTVRVKHGLPIVT